MDIPALTTAAWTMLAPFLPVIASKGAEKLGEEAGKEIWTVIKDKLDEKPVTQKVVNKLLAEPESAKMQGAFQYQLEELLEEDAEFAKTLASLLEGAGRRYLSKVGGDGGTIVQGSNSVGVGKGGAYIGGNTEDSTIVIGNNNKIKK